MPTEQHTVNIVPVYVILLEEEIRETIAKKVEHSMQIELFLEAIWCPGNPN
jgi:hypothetical protein